MLKIKVFPLIYLMIVTLSLNGCNYIKNRTRDLGDIIDVTITNGIGVNAQVSAVPIGLGYNGDIIGISDGSWVQPKGFYSGNGGAVGAIIANGIESSDAGDLVTRHKNYKTFYFLFMPAFVHKTSAHYYSKIDIAASLGYGVKIGLNIGELIDFIGGIFNFDIYGDDISNK